MSFIDTLKWLYRLGVADVTLSEVRGYWEVKEPCKGGTDCRHAFRGVLGPCSGGGKTTIQFVEWGKRDVKGRFVSPYAEWNRQHARIIE